MIPFWSNDPTILLNQEYIKELWPDKKMQYEQKLNAISRMVILLTMVASLVTMSFKFIIVGVTTLLLIFLLYRYEKSKKNPHKEMFRSSMLYDKDEYNASAKVSSLGTERNNKVSKVLRNPETLEEFVKADFEPTTTKNPFGNVLLTQIHDEPNRKAAPPSFNPEINEDITKSKGLVQELNPDIKDTDKQLFGDLGERFYLDQSNRQFFSNANTHVTDDQGAFGQFLYGDMYSAKEDGIEGAIARVQDNYRYTLY